ncbi:helix-turn-helix transcriptional regulator [Rhodococcus qingshengii]|uniref:LuxR C-terminal-related transcriptional regulator n=1 Tax=Rhodococcus qingshengii TaxID=334542 RepID=UPI001AE6DCC3|nr:LuxR C-terminal-related transcriptional regulator [Rhodococcus qingshengii]MBP1051912.1 helix-turn-helix transcriptional regulator [Rhodococcus qingshengii]
MNRDNCTESSFIAGLLRDVDLTASPLRLFVTGTDASARPQVTRVVRKRIESGDKPVVTAVTHDVPADAIVVIADAQALTSDEIRALKELVQRDDLGVVVASDRIDPPLAPIYSNISSFGTVLHLNPLNRNDIRKIAAERRVPLDDRAVVALEHLSGGSFGAIEAYFAAASAGRPEMPNAIRTHILHQVTALHPIEREILEVSLAVPDIDAFELDLGQEKFSLTAAFDRALATGLFGSRSPLVASVLAESTSTGRIRSELIRIVESRAHTRTLDIDTARRLFDSGIRHRDLTGVLRDAVEASTPAVAADLFRRVNSIEPLGVADTLLYAQVSARSGDLDTACRLADSVIAAPDLDDARLAAAVRIRAASSAACGQLGAAADLYTWLGPGRTGNESPFAAITFLGIGKVDDANAALTGHTGSPSSSTVGATTLANGLMQSVTGSAPSALNTMSRALSLPGGADTSEFQPDSAPALVALALLHNGAHERAAAVVTAAIAADDASSHTWARLHLLGAWIAMVRGQDAILEDLPQEVVRGPLRERDALFLHALIVGLARRSGDLAQLRRAWSGAAGTLSSCSVDLFNLLPIGELWLAAVRLEETEQVEHLVDNARSLLRALGEPPLWSSPLHWYGVQASILSQSPADLLPHAHTLAESAKTHTYAAGLAIAGRQWLLLMQGNVDADDVEAAARTLSRIGLPWDAARLAGEAALRTPDTKSATALLHVARSLRTTSTAETSATDTATSAAPPSVLTEREQEVAELVVVGLTYREIGERLYISAKTVEHHVARIKRRVGAQSRSELLTILRSMTPSNK